MEEDEDEEVDKEELDKQRVVSRITDFIVRLEKMKHAVLYRKNREKGQAANEWMELLHDFSYIQILDTDSLPWGKEDEALRKLAGLDN